MFVVLRITNKFTEYKMKKILLFTASVLALVSCKMNAGNESKGKTIDLAASGDYVEVLYFHGKQRCTTCLAIESNTRAALHNSFAAELKSGEVIFREIDLSLPENEEIAEEYGAAWSSLFVVGHENGQENRKNLTEFGFANARTSPEEFKAGVVEAVSEMLD